jgi:hydroxymethylpyrimidine/phosphomethylpyrimidine kinase
MTLRILIIAGSDSGGGAGIQADIRTVTMLGGHAMTAVTAITAQNTLGVDAIHAVPTDMVLAQIAAVVSDIGVDAIKIGMIGSARTAHAVADALAAMVPVPVVFDPVMVATSGSVLADADTIAAFERLMAQVDVVTPNVPELAALTGATIDSVDSLEAAARLLARRCGAAVMAKGGHLGQLASDPAPTIHDLLVLADDSFVFRQQRLDTRHTHGTGCTLASAIATGLGAGLSLIDAVDRAEAFVAAALHEAPGLGQGSGPLGHALGGMAFYDHLARHDDSGRSADAIRNLWFGTR